MGGTIPGIARPELQALPTVKERMTFLYVEHSVVNRRDGAITITDARGVAHVPAASLSVLMLGPGTSISHRAMELIGDAGTTTLWVGEYGVRYYAHGRSLTQSSRLVTRQAELVSNTRKRLSVARRMYQMRFPTEEDMSKLTMQQLRGREGSRIRSVYRKMSREYGVPWSGREYDPDDFSAASPINKALSVAHACLYGAAHSVIVAMGCSPALGFVHTGHERSFVYDLADLYKAEVTIPIAFSVVADGVEEIEGTTRRRTRDALATHHLLERMVRDIRFLLLEDDEAQSMGDVEVLQLWDERGEAVKSGVSYGEKGEEAAAGLEDVGYGVILKE